MYAAANQAKLASLVTETDRANLGGVSTTLPMVTLAPSSAHNTRADYGAVACRLSAGYNTVLPNQLKSTSAIPILGGAPKIPPTDINKSLNWFKDELTKLATASSSLARNMQVRVHVGVGSRVGRRRSLGCRS